MLRGKLLAARQLGFHVGGFDESARKGKSNDEREPGMIRKIAERAQTSGGPVIVLAGRQHVPKVVEGLKAEVQVIALSTADHDFARLMSKDYDRHYQQICSPDIRSFRTSDALREGPFTNYIEFAGKAGVNRSRPPGINRRDPLGRWDAAQSQDVRPLPSLFNASLRRATPSALLANPPSVRSAWAAM